MAVACVLRYPVVARCCGRRSGIPSSLAVNGRSMRLPQTSQWTRVTVLRVSAPLQMPMPCRAVARSRGSAVVLRLCLAAFRLRPRTLVLGLAPPSGGRSVFRAPPPSLSFVRRAARRQRMAPRVFWCCCKLSRVSVAHDRATFRQRGSPVLLRLFRAARWSFRTTRRLCLVERIVHADRVNDGRRLRRPSRETVSSCFKQRHYGPRAVIKIVPCDTASVTPSGGQKCDHPLLMRVADIHASTNCLLILLLLL